MADQMDKQARSKGWQAKRFKKFPRFSIYLTRDKANSHLERNYISLNNRMLAYLAEQDPMPSRQTQIMMQQSEDSIVSDHAILMIQEVGMSREEAKMQQSTQHADGISRDQSIEGIVGM